MKRVRLTVTLSPNGYGALLALIKKDREAYRTTSKSVMVEQAILTMANGRLSKADVKEGVKELMTLLGKNE